eukprot:366030-Chlamydomonas_euryale.AAC.14
MLRVVENAGGAGALAPKDARCRCFTKRVDGKYVYILTNILTNTDMWAAARTEPPPRWWFEYCKGAMDLRRVAMRILSMPLSTSSIERA